MMRRCAMQANTISVDDHQMSVGRLLNLCHLCCVAVVLVASNVCVGQPMCVIVLRQRHPTREKCWPKKKYECFAKLTAHRAV